MSVPVFMPIYHDVPFILHSICLDVCHTIYAMTLMPYYICHNVHSMMCNAYNKCHNVYVILSMA